MGKLYEHRTGYKETKVGWIPEEWDARPVHKLCSFSSGHGFGQKDWSTSGLPIIRIQNLNRDMEFNYFSGEPRAEWLVWPGDLLFAWAGVKGVSFGPRVWDGPMGVLNQHIYKVQPVEGVNKDWLLLALSRATEQIEKKAHGFKSSLLHVHKLDITRQVLPFPPHAEQQRIANAISTWDRAIEETRKLIEAKRRQKKALMQQLLTDKRRAFHSKNSSVYSIVTLPAWEFLRAKDLFEVRSERKFGHETVLSVTQDEGVLPRNLLDRRIDASQTNADSYKLVEPGDFVISLRSFQGGLEYSAYRGTVSPAYHVIRPKRKIDKTFYRYYFKCYDFIGHLAVAVIGIRDGKQVSFNDFSFMNLPYPPIEEQEAIGRILLTADEEIKLYEEKLTALERQKRGLMQKLLTGEVRVKV
jgi:type I restriction enzyme, S subunit